MVMCQHKAPHREWEPALRHLGHDGDRKYPEPETLFDDYAGRGLAERDQDMTIDKTMTQRDVKLVTPGTAHARAAQGLGRLLRTSQRKVPRSQSVGRGSGALEYQRYMHDYLGCIKAVDESVGRLLKYLDDEGLADNTIVVYCVRPGILPGRARLVRQALDLRRVAADAAVGSLAGRDQAGQRER